MTVMGPPVWIRTAATGVNACPGTDLLEPVSLSVKVRSRFLSVFR